MLWIKGGRVIDPVTEEIYEADLWIENGKIIKIETPVGNAVESGRGSSADEVFHAEGMMIAPGLADTHVHFRDPGFTYKEDIFTGADAAKKGGYTEIVLMANTKPCVDSTEVLEYVLQKGKQTGIHIYSCANVTKGMEGKELVDMQLLSEKGAVGFTDDGIPLLEEVLVRKAMHRAAKLHKPISLHEEEPQYIQNNGIHAGSVAARMHLGGAKREAEICMIERDLRLAEETGATVVIQHISTKEGVLLVRSAKQRGVRVYAEATPHHFTLTQEAVETFGTLAKMNPPLREEEDRQAIIEGIQDGTIELIATDHAPHSKEEKERPFTEAPSGIIGLETAFSLGIRELVNKGKLSYPQLIHRMSTSPCALYEIDGGRIQQGKSANLMIFHPTETWKVEDFVSKASNSPFLGEELPGVIYATICDGKMVYKRK